MVAQGQHVAGGLSGDQLGEAEVRVRAVRLKPSDAKPLFTGKNLDGWKVNMADPKRVSSKWEVTKDGELSVKNGPGDLVSEKEFDNFVLQFECKTLGKALNSGIFFRGDRDIFWSGYEVQLRNEFSGGDPAKPVDFGTGGLYHRQPARRIVARDNEWFTLTISAAGRRISVWIDGTPVTSYRDPGPEGLNVGDGKARLLRGSISLQAHDPTTNLDFRSLCIAPMPRLSEK